MQTLSIGRKSPDARIYTCMHCGYHTAMLKGEIAVACARCKKKGQWQPTAHEILLQAKNVAKEVQKKSTWADKMSDCITDWCGSVQFAYIHIFMFGAWIAYNLLAQPFDPYPFGLLTMIVSLEAIMLSTFVLMSQRRAGNISDLRGELDYHVNIKSEKMIAEVKAMIADLPAKIRKEKTAKNKWHGKKCKEKMIRK